jgi:hypothetical protein
MSPTRSLAATEHFGRKVSLRHNYERDPIEIALNPHRVWKPPHIHLESYALAQGMGTLRLTILADKKNLSRC